MYRPGGRRRGVGQRPGTAAIDRHIQANLLAEQPGITDRLADRHIAKNRGDAKNIEAFCGKGEGERVIDANIGIKNYLLHQIFLSVGLRAPASLAALSGGQQRMQRL
ncbi:hypothetical protein D3C71_1945360 [compost metagenome]